VFFFFLDFKRLFICEHLPAITYQFGANVFFYILEILSCVPSNLQ